MPDLISALENASRPPPRPPAAPAPGIFEISLFKSLLIILDKCSNPSSRSLISSFDAPF